MKKFLWALWPVLIIVVIVGGLIGFAGIMIIQTQARTVDYVIDGDTLVMESGERVRISNIDAPEKGEEGYDHARILLRTLIHDKYVELERLGEDKYGRTLARVKLDGADVGEMMIELGAARRWEE